MRAVLRRDFVANVSHELKTPLTSAQALLVSVQSQPEEGSTFRLVFPREDGAG